VLAGQKRKRPEDGSEAEGSLASPSVTPPSVTPSSGAALTPQQQLSLVVSVRPFPEPCEHALDAARLYKLHDPVLQFAGAVAAHLPPLGMTDEEEAAFPFCSGSAEHSTAYGDIQRRDVFKLQGYYHVLPPPFHRQEALSMRPALPLHLPAGHRGLPMQPPPLPPVAAGAAPSEWQQQQHQQRFASSLLLATPETCPLVPSRAAPGGPYVLALRTTNDTQYSDDAAEPAPGKAAPASQGLEALVSLPVGARPPVQPVLRSVVHRDLYLNNVLPPLASLADVLALAAAPAGVAEVRRRIKDPLAVKLLEPRPDMEPWVGSGMGRVHFFLEVRNHILLKWAQSQDPAHPRNARTRSTGDRGAGGVGAVCDLSQPRDCVLPALRTDPLEPAWQAQAGARYRGPARRFVDWAHYANLPAPLTLAECVETLPMRFWEFVAAVFEFLESRGRINVGAVSLAKCIEWPRGVGPQLPDPRREAAAEGAVASGSRRPGLRVHPAAFLPDATLLPAVLAERDRRGGAAFAPCSAGVPVPFAVASERMDVSDEESGSGGGGGDGGLVAFRIPPPQRKRIVVVGAGIAGLATARMLTLYGHDVVVIEPRGRPGGRIRTDRDRLGMPVDMGAMISTGQEPNPCGLLQRQASLRTHIISNLQTPLLLPRRYYRRVMAMSKARQYRMALVEQWVSMRREVLLRAKNVAAAAAAATAAAAAASQQLQSAAQAPQRCPEGRVAYGLHIPRELAHVSNDVIKQAIRIVSAHHTILQEHLHFLRRVHKCLTLLAQAQAHDPKRAPEYLGATAASALLTNSISVETGFVRDTGLGNRSAPLEIPSSASGPAPGQLGPGDSSTRPLSTYGVVVPANPVLEKTRAQLQSVLEEIAAAEAFLMQSQEVRTANLLLHILRSEFAESGTAIEDKKEVQQISEPEAPSGQTETGAECANAGDQLKQSAGDKTTTSSLLDNPLPPLTNDKGSVTCAYCGETAASGVPGVRVDWTMAMPFPGFAEPKPMPPPCSYCKVLDTEQDDDDAFAPFVVSVPTFLDQETERAFNDLMDDAVKLRTKSYEKHISLKDLNRAYPMLSSNMSLCKAALNPAAKLPPFVDKIKHQNAKDLTLCLQGLGRTIALATGIECPPSFVEVGNEVVLEEAGAYTVSSMQTGPTAGQPTALAMSFGSRQSVNGKINHVFPGQSLATRTFFVDPFAVYMSPDATICNRDAYPRLRSFKYLDPRRCDDDVDSAWSATNAAEAGAALLPTNPTALALMGWTAGVKIAPYQGRPRKLRYGLRPSWDTSFGNLMEIQAFREERDALMNRAVFPALKEVINELGSKDPDTYPVFSIQSLSEVPAEVLALRPFDKDVDGLLNTGPSKLPVTNALGRSPSPATLTFAQLRRSLFRWHAANLEYGCAANLSGVSFQAWDQDDHHGYHDRGAHTFLKDGYDCHVRALTPDVAIRYNTKVTHIIRGAKPSSSVEAGAAATAAPADAPPTSAPSKKDPFTTFPSHPPVRIRMQSADDSAVEAEEIEADAVVVTVPVGVLQQPDSISFEPELPTWKTQAISAIGMGLLNKVILRFPRPFWRLQSKVDAATDELLASFGWTTGEAGQEPAVAPSGSDNRDADVPAAAGDSDSDDRGSMQKPPTAADQGEQSSGGVPVVVSALAGRSVVSAAGVGTNTGTVTIVRDDNLVESTVDTVPQHTPRWIQSLLRVGHGVMGLEKKAGATARMAGDVVWGRRRQRSGPPHRPVSFVPSIDMLARFHLQPSPLTDAQLLTACTLGVTTDQWWGFFNNIRGVHASFGSAEAAEAFQNLCSRVDVFGAVAAVREASGDLSAAAQLLVRWYSGFRARPGQAPVRILDQNGPGGEDLQPSTMADVISDLVLNTPPKVVSIYEAAAEYCKSVFSLPMFLPSPFFPTDGIPVAGSPAALSAKPTSAISKAFARGQDTDLSSSVAAASLASSAGKAGAGSVPTGPATVSRTVHREPDVVMPTIEANDDSFGRVVLGEQADRVNLRGQAYMFWCMDRTGSKATIRPLVPPGSIDAEMRDQAMAYAAAAGLPAWATDAAAQTDGSADADSGAEDDAAPPVIIAMMAGAAAHWVEQASDEEVMEAVMGALRGLFGTKNVPEPEAHLITRWASDPYARGSYSYLPPFSHGAHYDLMAAPVDNIYFAGEGTNRHHPTTAAGAFESGVREAVRLGTYFGRSRDPDVLRLLELRAARIGGRNA
jgi:monoamine oxidase